MWYTSDQSTVVKSFSFQKIEHYFVVLVWFEVRIIIYKSLLDRANDMMVYAFCCNCIGPSVGSKMSHIIIREAWRVVWPGVCNVYVWALWRSFIFKAGPWDLLPFLALCTLRFKSICRLGFRQLWVCIFLSFEVFKILTTHNILRKFGACFEDKIFLILHLNLCDDLDIESHCNMKKLTLQDR